MGIKEEAGGAGKEGEGGANDDVKTSEESRSVSPEDHKRAIDDLHKYKSRWRETSSKIQEYETKLKSLEESKLKEQEDFKTLAEQYRAEAESQKAKNKKLLDSVVYAEKYRAVYPELKKLGLRDDAQELLSMQDFHEVEVETTSEGRFLVNNAADWSQTFKKKFPFAFETKKAPNINGGGGTTTIGDSEALTAEKLILIERECRKKGNMAPYYEAHKKYVELRKH
jgi:hypothetical protein